jgi:hypothetical protein
VRRNPQHRSLLTVVSATSAPPFQTLLHQRNVCHTGVNRFTWQTLPTGKRNNSFTNAFALSPFAPQTTHNRTLLFGSTPVKHGPNFDYWNQPLNMGMCVWYPHCYEAGLCCYLETHIENRLRPLQLFYFHLWPVYWLSLVGNYDFGDGVSVVL